MDRERKHPSPQQLVRTKDSQGAARKGQEPNQGSPKAPPLFRYYTSRNRVFVLLLFPYIFSVDLGWSLFVLPTFSHDLAISFHHHFPPPVGF